MPTSEHTINDALAASLRGGRHAWRKGVVYSESLGMLKSGAGRPDILVLEPFVSPVAIETEVIPAPTVEPDAKNRLGIHIKKSGATILSSIALKLPKRFRDVDKDDLHEALSAADDFQMALFTGESPTSAARWPLNQWIKGGVSELSLLTQAASVPPELVDKAADELMAGIREAASLYAEVAETHSGAIQRISDELRQDNGEQTWRMASAILANTFVFHDSLAGGSEQLSSVRSLDELAGDKALTKTAILAEWNKILEVNYWSIFDIARRILEHTPSIIGKRLIEIMVTTASNLLEHRLMRSHDLTGAVFQRLIADRKFLAAFYTTPPSAALLAGLAIKPQSSPAGKPWSDTAALKEMRIADFACGTGTLLSAAYQRVGQFHELAGGDARELHAHMMGGSLVGCDVLPAAAHLTAASLASVHPTITYDHSSIMTLAYGLQPNKNIALGSWDLLNPQRKFEILAITAKGAHGTGEVTKDIWSSIPHYGFDLVLMNPPFTRPTGHEGDKVGVRNPMFAAFKADDKTQKQMAKTAATLSRDTNYHGNAGEGSAFLALGDRKLKEGGTLAMVLPLSFMSGDAWKASRSLATSRYKDLILVTNAGLGGNDVCFSSDTGMGECLVIGKKSFSGSTRAAFVTLNERPDTTLTGAHIANSISNAIATHRLRGLEDGPVGGTPILVGKETVGHAIDAPLPQGWQLGRVRDFSLAQTAHQLANGKIWLPGVMHSSAQKCNIAKVGAIGEIGPYHADIQWSTASKGIRGPFQVVPLEKSKAVTYPALWKHDAERERTLQFAADSECVPRKGKNKDEQALIDRKIQAIAATASHCHFNQNFQFNSQSTAMQFTKRRTIGGRAWLSISLPTERHEMALVLWANTSLGLLMHWWLANKQQIGRGNIGKNVLQDLLVLDVTKLSEAKLEIAEALFETLKSKPLRPLNEIDKDTARQTLDEEFMTKILGTPKKWHVAGGPMELIRQKLAHEPSIVGHKVPEDD